MNKLLSIVLALLLVVNPAFAMKKGKSGPFIKAGGRYKNPSVTPNQTGNDLTVNLNGSRSGRYSSGSGGVTIVFKNLKDQLAVGEMYEVTTGQNFEDGKVSVNFTSTKSNRGGTTITASDEESTVISGKVTITAINGDDVTVSFKATLGNTLRSRNSRERRAKKTKVSGRFTVNCPGLSSQ